MNENMERLDDGLGVEEQTPKEEPRRKHKEWLDVG